MSFLQSALGVLALLGIAWLASEQRRAIHWRPVWSGIVLAMALALTIRWVPGVSSAVAATNGLLDALMDATRVGTAMVFGYLGGGALPYDATHPEATFVLATQALPLILVVSALSALLFQVRHRLLYQLLLCLHPNLSS